MSRLTWIGIGLVAAAGLAVAQTNSGGTSSSSGSAASSTGTTTSQQEMNRGVPGVDVDRNARGGLEVTRDRNTDARNAVPGSDRADRRGTGTGTGGTRAPRTDRG